MFDSITDTLTSSVLARLKEWALGTATQWLHDLVGRYLENITMPGVIALGVAASAALVLLASLAFKVVKTLTSGRGMLVCAGVMLAGLGVVWFTWAKPQLPFFGYQMTALEEPLEGESLVADEIVMGEGEPAGFSVFPTMASVPVTPLPLPTAVIPIIPAPIVIASASSTSVPSQPAGHAGGHPAVVAGNASASALLARAAHVTSAVLSTQLATKATPTKPAGASPAGSTAAHQKQGTSPDKQDGAAKLHNFGDRPKQAAKPAPAPSQRASGASGVDTPSKASTRLRQAARPSSTQSGSAFGFNSANAHPAGPTNRSLPAASHAQAHPGFASGGMNAGYDFGQSNHAQLQAQQHRAQLENQWQMEMHHANMMFNQQMHHQMNGGDMGMHPMNGGHEFSGHPMGGGMHPAAHHMGGFH